MKTFNNYIGNMENNLLTSSSLPQKYGAPVYKTNPSIPTVASAKKRRRNGEDRRGIIISPNTGEIIGEGGAMIYEIEEVDEERFVKLYLAGIKQASGLSRSGLAVFEIVYNALRGCHGNDEVQLSFIASGLTKGVYYKGMRELLEREFIFRTPYDSIFFVNIQYLFNGDRLAFVKAYHMAKGKPMALAGE